MKIDYAALCADTEQQRKILDAELAVRIRQLRELEDMLAHADEHIQNIHEARNFFQRLNSVYGGLDTEGREILPIDLRAVLNELTHLLWHIDGSLVGSAKNACGLAHLKTGYPAE